jgi:hypothetical protein
MELSRLQNELWTILEQADTFKTVGDVMAPIATLLRDSLKVVVPKPTPAPKAAPAAAAKSKGPKKSVYICDEGGPTLVLSDAKALDVQTESLDST